MRKCQFVYTIEGVNPSVTKRVTNISGGMEKRRKWGALRPASVFNVSALSTKLRRVMMIVFRLTHKVKPGCTQEVVDLLKEYIKHSPNQNRMRRIYHDRIGQRHTVIWESEYENFTAYAKSIAAAEWKSHPMAGTFWERLNKLVESGGSTELWNLE